ncbi:MAG TPA: glycosyltransferase family 39 protein [Gemmataceae bacterium]|nr:glycosyltransferase family 39 protein [Gemmataceae bacterium]
MSTAARPNAIPLAVRVGRWADSRVLWTFLLLLGLTIRLRYYLCAASYWYDESFVVLAVRSLDFTALLGPRPYNLISPPLYLWIVRCLYLLGGDGELLMRLPAFAAGVVALLLMIPLTRRLLPGPWAVWAFALAAVSPHAVSHGSEVHPYTLDLCAAEFILLCTFWLLEPGVEGCGRRWAVAGLGAVAAVGLWASFPSAFVLAGASAALLIAVWRRPTVRGWVGWAGLNAAIAASGALLWWFSARHMYYPGMIEHWTNAWGGFPDWRKPLAAGRWLLYRPYEICNYANRDLGVPLAALVFVGGVALAFRSPRQAAAAATPFMLAVSAALVGKYPLAHRTTMFLPPCVWLLAAVGLRELCRWAGRHRGKVAVMGALMAGYAAAWTAPALIWPVPDPGLDYRGAYQFVHAHQRPGDLKYCQMAVVYDTYYGTDPALLRDEEFPTAERRVGEERLWAVFGDTRLDMRRRLEIAGGRVVLEHHVQGLVVLLFEPGTAQRSGPARPIQ